MPPSKDCSPLCCPQSVLRRDVAKVNPWCREATVRCAVLCAFIMLFTGCDTVKTKRCPFTLLLFSKWSDFKWSNGPMEWSSLYSLLPTSSYPLNPGPKQLSQQKAMSFRNKDLLQVAHHDYPTRAKAFVLRRRDVNRTVSSNQEQTAQSCSHADKKIILEFFFLQHGGDKYFKKPRTFQLSCQSQDI